MSTRLLRKFQIRSRLVLTVSFFTENSLRSFTLLLMLLHIVTIFFHQLHRSKTKKKKKKVEIIVKEFLNPTMQMQLDAIASQHIRS